MATSVAGVQRQVEGERAREVADGSLQEMAAKFWTNPNQLVDKSLHAGPTVPLALNLSLLGRWGST